MTAADRPADQRPRLRTAIPGPASRALRAREDAHIAPGLQSYAVMSGIVVDHAVGSAVTDVDGNTFLDFIGGIGVGALGHAHPRIVDAIQRQVARVHVGSFTSEARVELVERVADARARARAAPRSSSTRAAPRPSRARSGSPRATPASTRSCRFWGGFHGKTMGALSPDGLHLQGGPRAARPGRAPRAVRRLLSLPGEVDLPVVRPRVRRDRAQAGQRMAGTGSVAAVVVEPMQGTAGNVIPPDDFLPAIADLRDELGALLVADEMITGFGRTGRWWGVAALRRRPRHRHHRQGVRRRLPALRPPHDATTIARAAAVEQSLSGSSSSYGGNPLAAAAGAAAVAAIDDEGLVDNARDVGAAMLDATPAVRRRLPLRRRGARPRALARHRARPRQEDHASRSRARSRGVSSTSACGAACSPWPTRRASASSPRSPSTARPR